MSKRTVILVMAAVMVLIVFGVVRAQEQEYTLDTPELIATEIDGEVVLNWTEVEGATRYDLQVWDCVNEWRPISENELRTTQAVHTDPADEITYMYTVQALNDQGEESDWAAILKYENDEYEFVRETVNPIPSPDFDIVAQDDHIQLQYANVEKAVGYQARVWYEGAGDDWLWLSEANLDLDSRTFSYTDVQPGVTYFFVMRSYSEDKCGYSDWSAYQAHTFAGTGGGTGGGTGSPDGVEATATPTATPNTGGPGPGPGPANTATPTPTATPSATPTETLIERPTFTGVIVGTPTPTPSATPVRPTLTLLFGTETVTYLGWEGSGLLGVSGYDLQYKTTGTWITLASNLDANRYYHRDIDRDATYHYRVRAVISPTNQSAWSNVVTRMPPPEPVD